MRKSIPVAPRRMNRNVRAFPDLYGAELPFIDARDLPPGPIGSVTLVDTQSLVTLKGMSQKTAVQVVDHHAAPELPERLERRTSTSGGLHYPYSSKGCASTTAN
jgi:hypothetical protein